MVVSLRTHNGVLYVEHSKTPIPIAATVSHNGRELKFMGSSSIVEMRNSWKYGHELHVTVHCDPLQVVRQKSNPTKWSRIETAMPFILGRDWLERALNSLLDSGNNLISDKTKLHQIL